MYTVVDMLRDMHGLWNKRIHMGPAKYMYTQAWHFFLSVYVFNERINVKVMETNMNI